MTIPVFSVSPDPTCMLLTPKLRHALTKLRRAIDLRQGLCCVFGSNGFGKSSLLRNLAAALSSEPLNNVALIAESTDASRGAFLRSLLRELNISPQRSSPGMIVALEEFLEAEYDSKRNVIILIDEAQLLRLETMEVLRSLLNFETHTEKLCQVVLAGQLELRDKLLHKRYKAFRSRIVAPVVLERFTLEETAAMIQFRHDYWNVPNRFTSQAVKQVYNIGRGVPRDIVVLCSYAYSACEGRDAIGVKDVESAAAELLLSAPMELAEAV